MRSTVISEADAVVVDSEGISLYSQPEQVVLVLLIVEVEVLPPLSILACECPTTELSVPPYPSNYYRQDLAFPVVRLERI